MARRRTTHKPRTKAMLLPLPLALAQKLSLENHISLAAIRSGHGTPDTMCALLRVLYVLFYMLEGNLEGTDLSRLLEAEPYWPPRFERLLLEVTGSSTKRAYP
ncbi:hypothetical protein [Burkholderia territorii]|uniref:hypothetical protein n=1 Tax=Burkholderia territorii TaxID=1503055 RepID=UPI0012D8D7BF|nr:hypothetical protein [Burkholderia territorii]